MDITITPGKLSGKLRAIPSKSQAHRLLICAALADAPTTLLCPETNRDIEATAQCLRALGAFILRTEDGYCVQPIRDVSAEAVLPCHDSGSTLRFLMPLCGVLGVRATFAMEGRLPQRPLSPLWEEMMRMGCSLSRPAPDTIACTGRLKPGTYTIHGGVSSQFITGLLLALPILEGSSRIQITGNLESKPYVAMTRQAMALFGVPTDDLCVPGFRPYRSPGRIAVEGDWSNAAFFLAAAALGNNVTVENLRFDSPQGDRAAAELLPALKENITISVADIPDLVPILSVVAACNRGAVFTDISRLRLKESDRIASTVAMLEALGGQAEASENRLTVFGTGLTGGTVDSCNDHRIAMSAAIASTVCTNPVRLLGADSVNKSYPGFWREFTRLGGIYEQYLR